MNGSRARVAAAAGVVLACALAGLLYLRLGAAGSTSTIASTVVPDALGGARLSFVSQTDDHRGAVVEAVGSPPLVTPVPLECVRVHQRGGRGLCLTSSGGPNPRYGARIVDSAWATIAEFGLGGPPSRARISPDGRFGALTVFVTGHSYIGGGEFSTGTEIIDLATNWHENLESFAVTRAGEDFRPPDRNFWGVTFAADGDRFYATMRSAGATHLLRGSLRDRALEVIDENAECPSLSPDGTQLVFKVPVGDRYQLVQYDLATGRRRPLPQAGPVDDQVEWLDDHTILYYLDRSTLHRRAGDIWSLDLAQDAPPTRFVADAESPAIAR